MVSDSHGKQTSGSTIGIVGLGLIGGSVGLALRDPSRTIIGCDASKKSEQVALGRFCVDRIAAFEEVVQADAVFVAVPPGPLLEVAHKAVAGRGTDSVFTDCASVKSEIAAWIDREKVQGFVPGHPMAGHEKGGAEYASAWLFRGARWLLTPCKTSGRKAVSTFEGLVKAMGATPVRIEPAAHDRHVAILSHLPHVLAAELVRLADGLDHMEVGAGSWRDLTRVGGVDPELWTQIMMGNRVELAKVIEGFEGSLKEMRTMLESGDSAGLKRVLDSVKKAKARQEAQVKAQNPTKATPIRKGRRP